MAVEAAQSRAVEASDGVLFVELDLTVRTRSFWRYREADAVAETTRVLDDLASAVSALSPQDGVRMVVDPADMASARPLWQPVGAFEPPATFAAAADVHVPGYIDSAVKGIGAAWPRLLDDDTARRYRDGATYSLPSERFDRVHYLVTALAGADDFATRSRYSAEGPTALNLQALAENSPEAFVAFEEARSLGSTPETAVAHALRAAGDAPAPARRTYQTPAEEWQNPEPPVTGAGLEYEQVTVTRELTVTPSWPDYPTAWYARAAAQNLDFPGPVRHTRVEELGDNRYALHMTVQGRQLWKLSPASAGAEAEHSLTEVMESLRRQYPDLLAAAKTSVPIAAAQEVGAAAGVSSATAVEPAVPASDTSPPPAPRDRTGGRPAGPVR